MSVEIDIQEKYTCRICLEEDNLDNLIYPCKCNGNSKYIHRYCVNKWRETSKENNIKCDICNTIYIKRGEQFKNNKIFENMKKNFWKINIVSILLMTIYTLILSNGEYERMRVYYITSYSIWIMCMTCIIIDDFIRMSKEIFKKYILLNINKIYYIGYILIILYYTIGWKYTNVFSDFIYSIFIELTILQTHIDKIDLINREMDEIINYK